MFPKRRIRPELLDHADPAEAKLNLADLVRINRRFGGHSTLRKLMSKAVGDRETFSMLDVGAASGDTAMVIRQLYPGARVISLDYNSVNLGAAPDPRVIADAFDLPFAANSFDFVFTSLFLHHFSDEQVVSLLRSFHRVARRALLVVDLERHIAPYLFLRCSQPIFNWADITVHDGLRSVRASFRTAELGKLAAAAGVRSPIIETHRPAFRLSLLAVK